MNTHVDFKTAKRLKDKGFDSQNCSFGYQKSGKLEKGISMTNLGIDFFYKGEIFEEKNSWDWICLAPTIAEVVMWLYEKHGIWISVNKDINYKWANNYFNYQIISENKGSAFSDIGGTQPNTPTEAYQEAIKYVLTNLI